MPYTPMMLQYLEVKEKYKNEILFYRLGDFYEMFFEDAKTVSRELELTLTGKSCGMEERAPMCGVPYHSAETYIARLVKKGYTVVVCEQAEDPATAKGIVRREVSRIITPGTVTESTMLQEGKNNYLCSMYVQGSSCGLCFCDVSTAKIFVTQITDGDMNKRIINELATYSPSEVITNADRSAFPEIYAFVSERLSSVFNDRVSSLYRNGAYTTVCDHFGRDELDKAYLNETSPAVDALGALLLYIADTQKVDLSYLNKINSYDNNAYLGIDVNTRRNLELCETMRTREKKGTLLWVLDKTKTAMGARLLRKWIEMPLVNCNEIVQRQNAVKELYSDFITREEISHLLSEIGDLERLMTRVVYNTTNGKDMKAIEQSINVIKPIKEYISKFTSRELQGLCDDIDTLDDIGEYISNAIKDDPPFSIREGGFIKEGFSKEADELREMMNDGHSWMARIEQQEKELTGIKNLKVGYNRVFGYYIEVTNSYKDMVPENYVRKQTLTGAERYITQELKEMETKVLGAKERLVSLEYELFQRLREYVAANLSRVQKTATSLSKLDVYVSLSDVAKKNNYTCPEVDTSDCLDLVDSRHPVVEKFMKNEMFVPNDVHFDENRRLLLITGPNMAGKSTYMRQTALIVIMAQIGSFVPARSARIGVVDKVFTRIGASDDLAQGQSTFMLEMSECAYILKNATKRSLVVYDEIGRGTSTYDGMSIARAIVEYTVSKKLNSKTMFATHYHELTELSDVCKGVSNFHIVAKKRGDDLIFLRKIVEGATDKSYGIEVAKLAGVPKSIVDRANEILREIEEKHNVSPVKSQMPKIRITDDFSGTLALDSLEHDRVIDEIKKVDVNTLTPIEALTKLYELKKMLE